MAAVTLQDLINRSLQRADMINAAGTSSFATTAELIYLANTAAARLHDLMVAAYDDQYMAVKTFPLIAGQESYDFVTDLALVDASGNPTFYKAREVFLTTGSGASLSRYKLSRFNTNELTRLNNAQVVPLQIGLPTVFYRLLGRAIYFEPIPSGPSGYNVELWYVPQQVKLVNLTDALDYQTVFGWDEYIVNDMAINLKLKEEADVSALMARQADFERKLEGVIQARDIATPARVTDVFSQAGYGGWGMF